MLPILQAIEVPPFLLDLQSLEISIKKYFFSP
jgi:hypothetical protein